MATNRVSRVVLISAIGVSFVGAFRTEADGATITVGRDGAGDYPSIQPAVDAAEDGDTVLVKSGEYRISGPINFNGLHDPNRPESPRVKNITLRAEGPAEDTVIRFSGERSATELMCVVIFEHGESEASVLEGFTLTDGINSGVRCLNGSSPTLIGCRIIENTDRDYGGGVYCEQSSPTLRGCTIKDNTGEGGGGVSCTGGALTVTDCTIEGNQGRDGQGGGIYCSRASLSLTDCRIAENMAWDGSGGGVACLNSQVTMTNCVIVDNAADDDANGGGLYCYGSALTMTDCTVSGNLAEDDGGGILCRGGAAPRLTNCVIAGNLALGYGGAICAREQSSPELTHCTIVDNRAWQDGGIQISGDSYLKLTFCIAWQNGGASLSIGNRSRSDVSYSCIESEKVWPGTGNINEDPLFCLPGEWDDNYSPEFINDDIWTEGDYRLEGSSPAIGDRWIMGAELGFCDTDQIPFVRSDANGDDNTNISDAVTILMHLFLGATEPSCEKAADADDNGALEMTDAIYTLSFLFLFGPEPKTPFPECGIDPTADGLDCREYSRCQ